MIDGWAAYGRRHDAARAEAATGQDSDAVVTTTRHVAEGEHLTLVLGCGGDGDAAVHAAKLSAAAAVSTAAAVCDGSVRVTVLNGETAVPLGPASCPAVPQAGPFSSPVDVLWSSGTERGVSGLTGGASVALRIELTGAVEVYSFTYD